jgi:sulfonate transport system substrate-binding protein
MKFLSRRAILASALLAGLLPTNTLFAADKPASINIDWATYNPVSMVLKEKGLIEKEFAKDGIAIHWVQTLGSNKALEFLNAGSIDFGSTAGSAALVAKINGNPIKSVYVYSQPEWTALVTRKDTNINRIADLKGKRVAVTRGTDPHIFLVRALQSVGLTEKDITPVLLQHPDGKTALIRGDVDAWAGLDPMMAQAELEDGARLFYRNKAANTWGILNVREEFLKEHPDLGLRGGAQVFARQLRRGKACVPGGDQAVRCGRRQATQGAHDADLQQDRARAARLDPAGRHRLAEGRRDQV